MTGEPENRRNFTVVVVDEKKNAGFVSTLIKTCPSAEIWQLNAVGRADQVEVTLHCARGPIPVWMDEKLFRADVLVINPAVDCLVKEWRAEKRNKLPGGVSFLIKQHADWKGQIICVVGAAGGLDDEVGRLTRLDRTRPAIMHYEDAAGSQEHIISMIQGVYESFQRGYVDLSNIAEVEFAARTDYPVLIVGEAGTGKQALAELIHRRWVVESTGSGRVIGDYFRPINCAALTPELARSELFGHVRGSFTGADDHRLGECLIAAGLQAFRSRQKGDSVNEYKKLLVKTNKKYVMDERGYDVRLKPTVPAGTLFLDLC